MKMCPQVLDPEIVAAIERIGQVWYDSPDRPRIAEPVLVQWDTLITEWVSNPEMPLVVRTSKACPGSPIVHSTARILIPSDNSPASWVFTLAERGECPKLAEVKQLLLDDRIPFAFAIDACDRATTKYLCNLNTLKDNPNKRGWKVAHITPVGMGLRGDFASFNISVLETHFVNLMSPRNLYVVPKCWSGLAEIESVNAGFRRRSGDSFAALHAVVRDRR